MPSILIITLDGPAGVGKSTLAQQLADRLGFPMLGSGIIYRLVAYQALRNGVVDDIVQSSVLAKSLANQDWLAQAHTLGDALRDEAVAKVASQMATYMPLRASLLELQQRCARSPGLVAEGRDMGTVVFPKAQVKFFVTADVGIRAKRRCLQQGYSLDTEQLARMSAEIAERDKVDIDRTVAPLVAAKDAWTIDTSHQQPEETMNIMFSWIKTRFPQITSL